MNTWQFKITYAIILFAIIIVYPFVAIKYFETTQALSLVWNYFFIPVSLLAFAAFIFLYVKKIRGMESLLKSKSKQMVKDIATIIMGGLFCIMVANGMIFSSIITTNTYFGTPEAIVVNEPVMEYSYNIRKGRTEHHIKFENTKTKEIVSLTVYRKYKVGEIFSKKMYRGYWGILYSKD